MNTKKKMIEVDALVHQMIKELAVKSGLTLKAYMMKIAYEQKAKELENGSN